MYRLDEHPRTCVRYDVHAVYLGTPGANMDCPAGIVGRTQTVSFIPAGNAATGTGPRAEPASPPSQAAAGLELQRLPAVHSAISQNADRHELEVTLGAAGPAGRSLAPTARLPA